MLTIRFQLRRFKDPRFSLKLLFVTIVALMLGISLALGSMTGEVILRNTIQIVLTLPLHVEGNTIKDSANRTVILRGVDYTRFIDGTTGDWYLPDGGVEWATWDTTAIAENLDAMKSWGVNCIRVLGTTQFWVNNTGSYQSHLETFISMAQSRGLYVALTFWRNNGSLMAQPSLPFSPYDKGNNVMNSSSDFVNFWSDVATKLEGYPNVIFELWNEPNNGNNNNTITNVWFNTTQLCIEAIRATGATQIIVPDWQGVLLDLNPGSTTIQTMDYITTHAQNDSLGNLIYTAHFYRSSFYNSATNYSQVYSYSEMLYALNKTKVLQYAATVPLWMGEIGADQWWTGQDLINEYAWYNNTLTIFDQYGIGYCGWLWWDGGAFGQLLSGSANYDPSAAGIILKAHLS